MTCFHFPTAAAIPSGYFTLSSKNENSPLPEDLLYFRALSSVAWLTGLCRNGNLFNFPLVPTSQLSRNVVPQRPKGRSRTHRFHMDTPMCTRAQGQLQSGFRALSLS